MPQSGAVGVFPAHKIVRRRYCCLIVNQMKKDLDQLRTENERIQFMEEECKMKMYTYQQLSMATDKKLDHLLSLGNEISSVDCRKSLGVRKFVKRVEEKRKFGDVSIRADVQTVQLASYTTPRAPLTRILAHIRSVAVEAETTMGKVQSHVRCMVQYHELRREIISFNVRLRDCDLTIRQFFYVSKATPYLTELGKVIDLFQENLTAHTLKELQLHKGVPPLQEGNQTGQCQDLKAFTHMSQLLTGELFGHENYLDPYSKIEPIVRHYIPEINNITPLSSNQQQLRNGQGQRGGENMWHYGNMVPVTDSTEISNAIQQLRADSLMSDSTATGWQQCGYLTRSIYECTVSPGRLSQSYTKSDDTEARCGRVAAYPPCHIDHTVSITNNGAGKRLPETEHKTTPEEAGNRTPFL